MYSRKTLCSYKLCNAETADAAWSVQYLAETLCLIHARAVDEHRVKEDGVALLHLQVHPGVLGVVATHSMVHLIYATLKTNIVLRRYMYIWTSGQV